MRRQSLTSSSLPLQILVYFDGYFTAFWAALNVALLTYKGGDLPYPRQVLTAEIVGVALMVLIAWSRLTLGSYGNKTQRPWPTLGFFFLSGIALVGFVYYLGWQTYITRFDVIANSMAIGFAGLEMFLSFFTFLVFWSSRSTVTA